jgi:hypothetical protein
MRAVGIGMHRAGDKFFAAAGGAEYTYGCIQGGDTGDKVDNVTHDGTWKIQVAIHHFTL